MTDADTAARAAYCAAEDAKAKARSGEEGE